MRLLCAAYVATMCRPCVHHVPTMCHRDSDKAAADLQKPELVAPRRPPPDRRQAEVVSGGIRPDVTVHTVPITDFGEHPDGRAVRRISIGEPPGAVLHLLDLGASVHRLEVACGDGRRRNVVLGHATPAQYLASTDYIGGTIGRYANRIAGGRFELDGDTVELATHDRGNHLHGGPDGFDRRMWDLVEHDHSRAVLRLVSPDGDQGFPGEVAATASFEVRADRVAITLAAVTDAPTVVNLTSHAYFNLDGDGAGTIDQHELAIRAQSYTPVDRSGIPSGGHAAVDGSPFDFRLARAIGCSLRKGHQQIEWARGIDHNYVIDGTGMRTAATLESPSTCTRLELRSDQPGLQVYTGNFLDGARPSTDAGLYRQGDGIALEPQRFPDSPNRPDFPSSVLRPGETYRSEIEWVFSSVPARQSSGRRGPDQSPAGTVRDFADHRLAEGP